jgi:hypothetical protein
METQLANSNTASVTEHKIAVIAAESEALELSKFFMLVFHGDAEQLHVLANFFPQQKLPNGLQSPPDDAILAAIAKAIFRDSYCLLKNPFSLPIADLIVSAGSPLARCIGLRIQHSVAALTILSDHSAPVRNRMAEDVEFIDVFSSVHLAHMEAGGAVRAEGPQLQTFLQFIGQGLFHILHLAHQKPKPYKKFAQQKANRKERDCLKDLLFAVVQFVQEKDIKEFQEIVNYVCTPICSIFYPEEEKHMIQISGITDEAEFYKDSKNIILEKGSIAETCDYCHSQPSFGSKLQRCSSCRVARYCSKSCQGNAWKNGHREACRK